MVAGTAPSEAHDVLDLGGKVQVLGPGHAVAEDRALERDHRRAGFQSLAHFGLYVQIFVHVTSSYINMMGTHFIGRVEDPLHRPYDGAPVLARLAVEVKAVFEPEGLRLRVPANYAERRAAETVARERLQQLGDDPRALPAALERGVDHEKAYPRRLRVRPAHDQV